MNNDFYHVDHPARNNIVYEYAGFWVRFAAHLVDGVLFLLVVLPILYLTYGDAYFSSDEHSFGVVNVLVTWVLPIVMTIWFWLKKGATPGKMLFGLKVLDDKTGNYLTVGQSLVRYFGYILSSLVFGLGYIWAAFDKKKQSWHDKLAKSVVVRER
ncbi:MULTISPECIES: RDD family protein [unclassified Moraxella]|uniref:RDD family protein n=1 Tax=unclassified Moraxella TaxID=2685852 RepID=UPI002B414F9B|nr:MULTISPECIES: RDD family protein [unclassified Moraxella]